MKMKNETKEKIYELLDGFDDNKRISNGLIVFLKTEENAKKMIAWLESSNKKCWTEDKIISVLDDITNVKPPKRLMEKYGLI